MKYIRTKDGIYEVEDEIAVPNGEDEPLELFYKVVGKAELINSTRAVGKADTIEELCDVFIFKDTCANEWHIVNQNDGISVLGASLFSDTLRGYIETEKGLIPVARYEKGELCLI